MPQLLNPFVYWAQSEENLFIKVDLKDVKNPEVNLGERKIQFEALGVGAHGEKNYGFSLDFYSEIDTDESTYKVQDSKIDFNIVKNKKSWWPRLTSKPQKPVWLKIDFDRWQSEEDLNSEDEMLRDVREDYADLYNKLQKEEFGYIKENIKKVYFIIYNLFMFVGFTYITSVLGIRYLRDGVDCFPGTYEAIGSVVTYIHILQFSEVLLTIIGLKTGSVMASALQIGGRLVICMLLIDPEPRIQVLPAVFVVYLVWSSIEIIRYPYYITQVCNINMPYLTWLRYTIWIPLYPLGISTECFIIYKSIPFIEETGRFSYLLPNSYNFTFSLVLLLRLYLLFFCFPIAFFLISNMYRMRMKKLGTKKWKVK